MLDLFFDKYSRFVMCQNSPSQSNDGTHTHNRTLAHSILLLLDSIVADNTPLHTPNNQQKYCRIFLTAFLNTFSFISLQFVSPAAYVNERLCICALSTRHEHKVTEQTQSHQYIH